MPDEAVVTVNDQETGLDVKQTAANLVNAALASQQKEAPQPGTQPAPVTPPSRGPSEAHEPLRQPPPPPAESVVGQPPPAEEVATVTEEQVEEIVEETGLPFDEVVGELADLGIAVETDIPEELRAPYLKTLESVKATLVPMWEEVESAQAAREEVEAFKQRLADRPKSVLLSLWATKPEVFAEVAEIAARAQEDETYRHQVLRELEVDAREAKVAARERQLTQQQREARSRRGGAMIQAAARKYGVPLAVADRFVGGIITGERNPDAFELSRIDGLVADLAKELKPVTPKPKPPRVATPADIGARSAAPTSPASGAQTPAAPGEPPSSRPGASSGFDSDAPQPGRGGIFRTLVKQAQQRVDQARRGG